METPNEHEETEHEGLTLQRIDNLLALRRRKSFPKACYPCRRRKVRCDHNHPCGSCVKHEQPELCTYLDDKGKTRRDHATSKASNRSTKERLASLADLERRMQTIAEKVVRHLGPLNAELPGQPLMQHQIKEGHIVDTPSIQGRPPYNQKSPASGPPSAVPTEEIGAPVHIGAESLASALVDILKSGQFPEDPPQSSNGRGNLQHSAHETMKLLYLTDTGSTHPFANLWKPGATVEDICLALPDDDTFERYVNYTTLGLTSG